MKKIKDGFDLDMLTDQEYAELVGAPRTRYNMKEKKRKMTRGEEQRIEELFTRLSARQQQDVLQLLTS